MNRNIKKTGIFTFSFFILNLCSINLFREYFHQKDSEQARLSRLLFLFFLLLTSYFLLFFSCSFLTNPDKTTVSGVVKLEGQTNHSGVKVSLYKLVDIETTFLHIYYIENSAKYLSQIVVRT